MFKMCGISHLRQALEADTDRAKGNEKEGERCGGKEAREGACLT